MRRFFCSIFFSIFFIASLVGDVEEKSIVSSQQINKKTVCLNMIVKDEKDVICRCLASVKPLIDYWVIFDTGSTDGTQEMIKDFMKDIPGELHERPWKNFGHNRNEALQGAKGKADFALVIDADEIFSYPEGYQFPYLRADAYYIMTQYGGTKYARLQLINLEADWRWVGVLHEYLEAPVIRSRDTLDKITDVVSCDGARSKDPDKYKKDARILEIALQEDPTSTRNQFYLAQSYRDAGDKESSILSYKKRVDMGGWDQEVFWSLYQIALMQEQTEKPHEVIVEGYKKAMSYRPLRIEPLLALARYYRSKDQCDKGYEIAKRGLHIKDSTDILFVENWVYDYGLLLEFSICAYYAKQYTEALLATKVLLADANTPNDIKELCVSNLVWDEKMVALEFENNKELAVAQ
jgi:glycosyltransferase involved in cell wall biosynthesis